MSIAKKEKITSTDKNDLWGLPACFSYERPAPEGSLRDNAEMIGNNMQLYIHNV